MKLSQDYIKKIEKQLGDLGNKIDELSEKVKSETKLKYNESIESLRMQMDDTLKKVGQNIDAQLREWESKIEKLKGKGKEEAKKEYTEIINNIKPRIEEYSSTLKELKNSGGGAWNDVKSGAADAWKTLKDSFAKAKEKFK